MLIYLRYIPTSYSLIYFFFFFNDTATTEIYTLSLHDALPIYSQNGRTGCLPVSMPTGPQTAASLGFESVRRAYMQRSEEHTSELQSLAYLVCRLLLEKKKKMQVALVTLDAHILLDREMVRTSS